eukprot:5579631-Prymnesium_polylepis.2
MPGGTCGTCSPNAPKCEYTMDSASLRLPCWCAGVSERALSRCTPSSAAPFAVHKLPATRLDTRLRIVIARACCSL